MDYKLCSRSIRRKLKTVRKVNTSDCRVHTAQRCYRAHSHQWTRRDASRLFTDLIDLISTHDMGSGLTSVNALI